MGDTLFIIIILITLLILVALSIILSIYNLRTVRNFFKKYDEDMESYRNSTTEFEQEFDQPMEAMDMEEVDEDDESQRKEEIRLEIDRDMERLNNEIKKNELIMEKLEKHYSTLRKVSKDMMESIIDPTRFSSFSDNYTPIPLMYEKPMWSDLGRNHIPKDQGGLNELWDKYVELTNVYSHQKTEAIKGILNHIFGGSDYVRVDKSDNEERRDSYYHANPILLILNNLYFGSPEISFKVDEIRRDRKLGKFSVLSVNKEEFIHGKTPEIMAFISIFQEILLNKNYSICDETMALSKTKIQIEAIIKDIKKLLNWFIFEEDNMIQCDMMD
ncbi:MAG: hypothetical protein ACYCSO_03680 [Cuniculiplasma sp.]